MAAVAVASLGCGSNEETGRPPASASESVVETVEPEAAAPTIRGTPTSDDLVTWLAQDHRFARARLGPHRLQYQARFSVGGGSDKAESTVVDDLALTWASASDEPPRFELVQHNDRERGRAVILADEHLYVRVFPRPWSRRAIESDLHEIWLDEAQRSVHDVVELVAHRLEIAPAGDADGERAGREVATYVLSMTDGEDTAEATVSADRAAWRNTAQIEAIEGRLVMDVQTGLWLDADIRVDYRASNDSAAALGSIALRGTVVPGPGDPVSPPADASEIPELPRYQNEQRTLLDGIAAI